MKYSKVFALLLGGLLPLPAMAYIDPGSGSAIMSAIIGFFVACWLVIKTYWYKLKSFFSPGSSKPPADSSDTVDGDDSPSAS